MMKGVNSFIPTPMHMEPLSASMSVASEGIKDIPKKRPHLRETPNIKNRFSSMRHLLVPSLVVPLSLTASIAVGDMMGTSIATGLMMTDMTVHEAFSYSSFGLMASVAEYGLVGSFRSGVGVLPLEENKKSWKSRLMRSVPWLAGGLAYINAHVNKMMQREFPKLVAIESKMQSHASPTVRGLSVLVPKTTGRAASTGIFMGASALWYAGFATMTGSMDDAGLQMMMTYSIPMGGLFYALAFRHTKQMGQRAMWMALTGCMLSASLGLVLNDQLDLVTKVRNDFLCRDSVLLFMAYLYGLGLEPGPQYQKNTS